MDTHPSIHIIDTVFIINVIILPLGIYGVFHGLTAKPTNFRVMSDIQAQTHVAVGRYFTRFWEQQGIDRSINQYKLRAN